jgi:hypothetical protein
MCEMLWTYGYITALIMWIEMVPEISVIIALEGRK